MNKLIGALAVSVLMLALQPSALAASAQQNKMKSCNAEAKTKALKGDERKSFMKECLSAKKDEAAAATAPAASGCEEKAVSKDGKKLAGAAKKTFMKKCEADASAAK